jgi:hypothetical protein
MEGEQTVKDVTLKKTRAIVSAVMVWGLMAGQVRAQDDGAPEGPPRQRTRTVEREEAQPEEPRRERRRPAERGNLLPEELREVVGAFVREHEGVDPGELLEFLRARNPDALAEVRELARQRRPEAREILRDLVAEGAHLLRLGRENPELFMREMRERDLNEQAERLGHELRRDGTDTEAETELRRVLKEAFDIRQERMRAQIEELAAELRRLQELEQKREENRDEVIDRRFKQLSGQLDYLEW